MIISCYIFSLDNTDTNKCNNYVSSDYTPKEVRYMKNILIIDDDIHIGNMLEEVLTKEGYGVSRAYSGTEALLYLSLQ